MATFKDWLTVTWQSGMPMQLAADEDEEDNVKARCGRAGSFAATPGEKLLELLRPGNSTPRRHSTAACASAPPSRSSGFVYCPSDALPYCPPSRLVPLQTRPYVKIPPPQIQMNPPPPVPQRLAPVIIQTPVPPPPPRNPKPPNRIPPPAPPRPVQTDPNGNKKQTIQNLPRLDCNKNPQSAPPRRLPQKSLPDSPFSPPPIPNSNQMKQSPSSSSNMSTRQDSNVSSDSYSQTSSPSYNTKTMEAPLLPNQHLNKSLNAKIAKSLMMKEQQEKDGNTAITKSISTPASLQTIVRFQNGSNMSLHHRMLRDMRGSNAQASPQKFRLAQLALNVVLLLIISGGFYAYFRANPTVEYVSQIINQTSIIESWRPLPEPSQARNPAPGVCLPVIVTFCQQHNITYNFTIFPNYVGHYGQRDAQSELEVYDAVVDVRCYELTALFLCSIFVPKCGPLGHIVRPCQSLCEETMRRCGFFLEVFGLTMLEYVQCESFPESTDTDICIGNKEVREAKQRATKPVCQSGFLCDVQRCIPLDWRCDGHVDCLDRSDEMNCRVCRNSADVFCGSNQCISSTHLCDGKVDCPRGQDEKNCLRLSESNGDIGHGELQLYRASNNSWYPACLRELDTATARNICSMMGYSWLNSSRLQLNTERAGLRLTQGGVAKKYREFKRNENGLLGQLNECDANAGRVQLVCHKYECGRRRVSNGAGTRKRIVGGVQASPGDWPFLAAILGGPEEVFYCAGVLVADQWVLTASHCVGNHSDVSGWTIQLGISRRRAHAHYGQKVKVQRVVPHPRYNIGVAHDNDIALFQLAERVRYHEHLSPVCLPPADRVLDAGTKCMVIGWGKRDDKDMSEYEPAVNEVEVPVLNRALCNEWLEHRDLNITEGMICAGYPEGGKDACQGDSGGPLLCRDKRHRHRWYVGGIVSWGIKCAHPRLPGVYAYVPKYIPWILQQISLYDSEHARTHGDYPDY